ncbi:hypothetical protein KFK09_028307 [Dendrobium nobile]|uniref:Reverse transcriptase zinc-binding domain-containing protein n=1 Tax=Dendrobium nobile TaxID=94219 RepID=A0A8T3A1M4_DENNO|nr:hypothetical protein KFK09_028307 [Dendrobium nobile]
MREECLKDNAVENMVSAKDKLQESNMIKSEERRDNYGPWVLVNIKRRKFKTVFNKAVEREAVEKKTQRGKTWNIKSKKTNVEEIKDNLQNELNIPVQSQDLQFVEEGEIIEESVEVVDKGRFDRENKENLGMEDNAQEISEGTSENRAVLEENQGEINQVTMKMSGGKTKLAKEMKMLGPIKGKKRMRRETKMENLSCIDVKRMMVSEWDFHHVVAAGKSGGILVLWKHRTASFKVTVTSNQCIIGELTTPKCKTVNVCIVYGNKSLYERRKLWEMIENYVSYEMPCLVGGDFNCLISSNEKLGGKSFVFSKCPQEMKEFMINNDYHDVGFIGPNYTWCNNKDGLARLWERLDRMWFNSKAIMEFPNAKKKQRILKKISDLKICGAHMMQPKFQNREAAEGGLNQGDLLLLRSMVAEFNTNLARIATWWRQRSKCQWIEEGEKNTSYYHKYASAKKKSNQILQIATEDGSLVSNQEDIHGIMENENLKNILDAEFTLEELKFTLNNMGNNKSPGADGASAYFFKNYWSIVEQDTWNAVNCFFRTREMPEQWKETVVVLIPKIQNARECSKYRPICLCQRIYKMVAGMILNRFKNCLPEVISEFQGAFIQGRSISNNCIITQEMVGKMRYSVAKPDLLSKAFSEYKEQLGMKLAPTTKKITHLLYDDDVLIMAKAFSRNARILKKIFKTYCRWTGQAVTHSLIPKSILLKIDKIYRSFLWHKENGKQGVHYIAWETLCLPSSLGEFGIHEAAASHRPLRSRMVWMFLQNKESLLHKFLFKKFGAIRWEDKVKRGASTAWKFIKDGIEHLKPIVRWQINNGLSININSDIWILDRSINKWSALCNTMDTEDKKVSFLMNEDGSWNSGKLTELFSEDMVKLIRQMEKGSNNAEDKLELIQSNIGKTISALSTEAIWFQKESKYTKHIWLKKLKLDQKVYLFWWRTLNRALPTMEWLCHRKLSDSKECPRDCHENENAEHVIVKCKRLKALLQELRRSGFNVPEFQNLEECNKALEQNSGKGLVKIYAVAVFYSWKSRNLTKHGNAEIPLAYAVVEIISHSSHLYSNPIEKNWHTNQHLLSKSWCPPPHGWIKLNVDATLSVNNMAGIAGILRDYKGRLLCAYGRKLTHWDIAHLEFKAIMSFGNYF